MIFFTQKTHYDMTIASLGCEARGGEKEPHRLLWAEAGCSLWEPQIWQHRADWRRKGYLLRARVVARLWFEPCFEVCLSKKGNTFLMIFGWMDCEHFRIVNSPEINTCLMKIMFDKVPRPELLFRCFNMRKHQKEITEPCGLTTN